MLISDIIFKMIISSEHVHGYKHSSTSHQECAGYEIRAKVCTIPTRPVSGCKKPGGNCMNSECNRNNSNAEYQDGTIRNLELLYSPLPERTHEFVNTILKTRILIFIV